MFRLTSICSQARRSPGRAAPKAQTIPAWGNAPGRVAYSDTQGLKARPITFSIPQISLIAFHTIFLEERTEFLLKRHLPVVRFLPVDVSNQRLQVSWPNRERSITSLPSKLRQPGRLSFEPFGRGRLQLFHQLRYIRRACQSNGKMYVVRNAPHAITLALRIAGNGSKIGVKPRPHRIIENGLSIFCAENNVNQNKRERLRHRVDYRAGIQPSYLVRATRTFTPGWYKTAPSALLHMPGASRWTLTANSTATIKSPISSWGPAAPVGKFEVNNCDLNKLHKSRNEYLICY